MPPPLPPFSDGETKYPHHQKCLKPWFLKKHDLFVKAYLICEIKKNCFCAMIIEASEMEPTRDVKISKI